MIYHRLTKRNNNRGISIISRAFPSNNQDKVKFVEVVFVLVAAITLCTRSLKRKLKQWLVIMLEIYDRCWYLKNYPTTIQEIQLNRILTSSLSNNVIILPLYCDYSFFLTKVYMLAGKGCNLTMKLTPKSRYWIKKIRHPCNYLFHHHCFNFYFHDNFEKLCDGCKCWVSFIFLCYIISKANIKS